MRQPVACRSRGTLPSDQFDVPCGPAIVLTCVVLFLGSLIAARLRR